MELLPLFITVKLELVCDTPSIKYFIWLCQSNILFDFFSQITLLYDRTSSSISLFQVIYKLLYSQGRLRSPTQPVSCDSFWMWWPKQIAILPMYLPVLWCSLFSLEALLFCLPKFYLASLCFFPHLHFLHHPWDSVFRRWNVPVHFTVAVAAI